MVPRSSSVILVAIALAVGLATGFSLGRGDRVASAQVGNPGQGEKLAGAEGQGLRKPSQLRKDDVEVYDQLSQEYDRFQHVNRMFELVAKVVSPTVVHIVTLKSQRTRKFEETGSGVIVRSDKNSGLYVLTNHHVVEGGKASKIRIFLHDGRALTPERIWSDAKADVAVLKLDRDDLPAARMGDSDTAAVGSWVLALGSPFGLMHSVSQGIISARGRHMEELQDVENQDFLQTDAAINPGNSGGPLVNMKGEVIGINNSIASNGGGNEGVGFSIPINLARWIMNELTVHGHVTRGALGVNLQSNFRQEDAVNLGLDRPRGAWIDKVYADSPAAKGGLLDGDVILQFAGVVIHDLNHLINTVSMTTVGVPVDVIIWRERREVRLKITVGDRERTLAEAPEAPLQPKLPDRQGDPAALLRRPNRPEPTSSFAMGLELVTLNPQLAFRYHLPETMRGALIVNIDPESPLSQAAHLNDVISKINEQLIQTAEDVARLMAERSEHDQLILSLDRPARNGIERYTFRVP
jgi:serine protease Do